MGMEKEWSANYQGHHIRGVAKSEGARLSVDNELLDVTNDLCASEEEATPVGVCGEEDAIRIEAFVKPVTLDVAIRVNDQWVVGGEVHAVA
jgi:hypothetical protein